MFTLSENGMTEQGQQEGEKTRNYNIPSGQCEVWAGLGIIRGFILGVNVDNEFSFSV